MTEKRFVYIEHKGADYILDNPNWELDFIEMLGDTLEAEEIVDLLNEQHETIQQLQKDSTILIHSNHEYRKENKKLIKMLDNVANYMQKEHREIPLNDFVEWWNNIATEGLDD